MIDKKTDIALKKLAMESIYSYTELKNLYLCFGKTDITKLKIMIDISIKNNVSIWSISP